MILDGGTVNGRPVVPKDYLDTALGKAGSEHNAAYGLLWWLNRPGKATGPSVATGGEQHTPFEGPIAPHAPQDTVWALGRHQQILAIVPSRGIVAVRLGDKPTDGSGFDVRIFTQDVLNLTAQ